MLSKSLTTIQYNSSTLLPKYFTYLYTILSQICHVSISHFLIIAKNALQPHHGFYLSRCNLTWVRVNSKHLFAYLFVLQSFDYLKNSFLLSRMSMCDSFLSSQNHNMKIQVAWWNLKITKQDDYFGKYPNCIILNCV